MPRVEGVIERGRPRSHHRTEVVCQHQEQTVRDPRERPVAASTAAQAHLAADLSSSLARTRMAWEAATLRGDAALRAGDRTEAVRALDEQRALLRDLHTQVDEAIGRAAVAREAGTIVEAAGPGAGPTAAADLPPGRRGTAGAMTGAVLAAAFGLAALLPGAPPVPEVVEVAADGLAADGGAVRGSEEAAAEGAEAVGEVERTVTLPELPGVEVAGGSDVTTVVAFERVTDVLGELHDALSASTDATAAGPVVEPAEVVTDDDHERGPAHEVEDPATPDGGDADPHLAPVDGLKDVLGRDRDDDGEGASDAPARLDLDGRLGGGDDDGSSVRVPFGRAGALG